MQRAKAIFLDRDGVINVKLPQDCYVKEPGELGILPGVARALRILKGLGYFLVVVTNQRGIGRGFMTVEDLSRVHDFMLAELEKCGSTIDRLYYCPHDKDEGCPCRKPEPGMILDACEDLHIDPAVSYTVGDSASDVAAGKSAGTRTVLIGSRDDENPDHSFPSLLDFAMYLERQYELMGLAGRKPKTEKEV